MVVHFGIGPQLGRVPVDFPRRKAEAPPRMIAASRKHPATIFAAIGAVFLLGAALSGRTEIPLRVVGPGYLVLRAEACRDGVKIERHFLLDLMCPVALAYYPEEALFLNVRRTGDKVDFEAGDAILKKVPVTLAGIRLLEKLTRDYSRELKEIPVVGIVGLPAFDGYRIEIDPEAAVLRLLPRAVAGDLPQEQPGRIILPLEGEAAPPCCTALLEGQVGGRLFFATGRPHSFLLAPALSDAGKAREAVTGLEAEGHELAGVAPFRSLDPDRLPYGLPKSTLGGLGWNFLRNYRLTVDGVNSVAVLDRVRTEPFDEAEQTYILAEARGIFALEDYLAAHPESPHALDAAKTIYRSLVDDELGTPEECLSSGRKWISLLDEKERAAGFLDLAEVLLCLDPVPEETATVIADGIEASRKVADREIAFRLQHQAGRFRIGRQEFRKARLHLLNAVFGLLHEGPVNLDTGFAWKGLNKPNRVWSYFLRALLDVEKTGPEALREFEKLRDEDPDADRTGLTRRLMERLEGRIESYSPPGERPPAAAGPLHRPFLEFFTGQACKPCVGATLGLEGAAAFFGPAITILTHHMHSPYPDPLVCREGMARADFLGVTNTPTLFVDGRVLVDEGAPAREAASLFGRIRKAVERTQVEDPRWTLSGEARLEKGTNRLTGSVAVTGESCRLHVWLAERALVYPGLNGIIVHWYVSRARLTGPAGAAPDAASDSVSNGGGILRIDADVNALWKELKKPLDEVEAELIDQDFVFRWMPSAPDPAEIVLVVYVTSPGSERPVESLVIVPAGAPREARDGEESKKSGKEEEQ
jgi:hypothetical protein